jgi:hypothetical protein
VHLGLRLEARRCPSACPGAAGTGPTGRRSQSLALMALAGALRCGPRGLPPG